LFNGVSIALRTFGASIYSSGRIPRSALLFLAVTLASVVAYLTDGLTQTQISDIGQSALFPGTPLLALTLSGLAVTEAHSAKTLLYLVMSPVPRSTLLTVRTLCAAALTGLTLGLIVVIATVCTEKWGLQTVRQMGAIALGALFYMSLFGLIQLLFRRGLFAGVLFYFLLDVPLARLPADLSMLSPSWHLRVLAGPSFTTEVARAGSFTSTPEISAAVLLMGTLICGAFSVFIFSRKDLGDLC